MSRDTRTTMAGVAAAEGVRPSQNSAFSAVVKKSFSSFSVDSILAPDSRPCRSEDDLKVTSSCDPCDLESDRDECDFPPSRSHEDDVEIHVDSEDELGKDGGHLDEDEGNLGEDGGHLLEDEGRLMEDCHTEGGLIKPTVLSPPREMPFPPGAPHPLLPPSLQPGLWPPLHLLHHHLALRAFASTCPFSLLQGQFSVICHLTSFFQNLIKEHIYT